MKKVNKILEQRCFKIDLKEFGIDFEKCPIMIKKALKIINQNFLELNTVAEIANKLNISLSHLEHEFARACNFSCKKLSISLKLYYACYLMENKPRTSIQQIAYYIMEGINEFLFQIKTYGLLTRY